MQMRLPSLAAGMEVGTVITWLKKDGDSVNEGEPILEVEADKANQELEAPASGTLRIVAQEGEEVEVGGLLANID